MKDQLAAFRQRELGRELGTCRRCGSPIRSQQHFIRADGLLAHVRCQIAGPATAPQ